MNNRQPVIVTTALLLALAAAWFFFWPGGTDPAVAELQAMQQQMFADNGLADAQRQALRDQFRQRVEGLTDAQRRQLFSATRGQWQERAQQRMDEFFTLTAVQQRQRLDEILNRMQQRQNEPRPTAGGNRDARSGDRRGGEGRGGRNMTEAQRDARAKRRLDRSSPKQRAQWAAFRTKLEERARERGIDPGKLPGRGGRGRFGRMA